MCIRDSGIEIMLPACYGGQMHPRHPSVLMPRTEDEPRRAIDLRDRRVITLPGRARQQTVPSSRAALRRTFAPACSGPPFWRVPVRDGQTRLGGRFLRIFDLDIGDGAVPNLDRQKSCAITDLENAFFGVQSLPPGHSPSPRAIAIGSRERRPCSRLVSYSA